MGDGGYGILGLIGNYVNARREREAKKEQEALKRYYEAAAGLAFPDLGNFMDNAKQNVHVALADLIGDKEYKEHQPFVEKILQGVGNAAIGTMSGTMPMWGQRIPQIPVAQDPQTGQPGQGAPPGQAAPVQPGQAFPGISPDVQGMPDAQRERIAGQLATLAGQAQGPQQQPGPLPGGTTPPSTLAPSTTEGGVTPATATGLIGRPGKGGFYPEPQNVIDVGRAQYLAGQGMFGKTPQEIQGIINSYHQEVLAGRMTKEDAIAAIQKSIQAYNDPATRAAGGNVWRPAYFEGAKDEKDVRLEENEASGLFRGVLDGKYRTDITEQEMADRGYTHGDKEPADIPKTVSVPANDPNFRAYIQSDPKFSNINLDDFAPDQKFNIARSKRGAGPFTGFPTLDATSAGSRNIEAQMAQAAQDSLEEYNPQTQQWGKITPARAREYAGRMFLERLALMNARMKNGLDVSAYKWGITVPASQLPTGIRVKGGAPSVELGKEPPLGAQGAQGAPDLGPRMQGQPAPQQGQPGAGQTPNVVPNQLPAGAQPPAAASPGAAPAASTPPQAPEVHPQTVQPVTPPQQQPPAGAAAAQQGGQALIPGSAVSSDQDYITNYLTWTRDKPMSSMAARGRTLVGRKLREYYASQGRNLTDEQLGAIQSKGENDWQAFLQAQQLNTQKGALVVPLVDTIDKFAKQQIAQARLLPDYGSRMSNSFHRDLVSQFQNNPELSSYKTSGLGLGSTWGQLVNSAVLSTGQLQATALEKTTEIISHNATFDEMAAAISRIVLESDTERWRYKDADYKIEQQKADSIFGKATNYGATIGPAPKEPPNLPPPPDGTTRRVKGTGQIVHYDALQGRYVPGPGRRKPFNLRRFANQQ